MICDYNIARRQNNRPDLYCFPPDNGNKWRKFCAVPRLYLLCNSLVYTLFNRGGNRRAFRQPGAGRDHFHYTVEPSPGLIRCRLFRQLISSIYYRHEASLELLLVISASSVFAVCESAKLPTPCLPTGNGSGNCVGNFLPTSTR